MLHSSKSESILQWYNALTTHADVQSLSQFADGSLFCDIVTCVYSQAEMGNMEMPKIDSEEGSAQANKIEIEQKYEIIEKFIDTFFQIQSSTLVAYQECMEGEDLELAKVCVILLSAMVQNFLSTDNESLKTIMLLDVGVQEDIKEFLALLLERSDNKGPLTKAELHKVLGKATKQKATPRRKKSDRGTPAKKTPAKHGERVSTMVYEDMMDSPLKGLLQSPVSQHKMVVQRFKWDTELSNLRKKYYEEESKVFDLMKEKRKAEEDFSQKKEELHQLKIEFRKFKEISEEKEGLASMERAHFLSEIANLKKLVEDHKEEIEAVNSEKNKLIERVFELEEKIASSCQVPRDQGIVAEAMQQVQEYQQDNLCKESELQECKKKIEELSTDLKTYKQLYEEGMIAKSEGPSSLDTPTRCPEIISNIFNADAEEKLEEMEKELNEKKEKLVKFENEAQKSKSLTSSLRSQLKEKTENMKAIFDKMSILQEQCDKLLKQTQNCEICGENVSVSKETPVDASNASTEIGSLWNAVPVRDNIAKTRSKSVMPTLEPANSVTVPTVSVNPFTIERLKIGFRQLYKLILRSKIVEDKVLLQECCVQTSEGSTIEDVVTIFEKTLSVLKKVLPRFSQSFLQEMATFQDSTQNEKLIQEHKKLQERLEEKENEVKAAEFRAKAYEEKMKYTKSTAGKQVEQLKNELSKWRKEYKSALESQEKLREDKKLAYEKFEKLKIHYQKKELENRKKPCDKCISMETDLREAKANIVNLQQNENNQKLSYFSMEEKVKNLKEKAEGLEKENKELKKRIQYRMGFHGNSSVLMDLQRKNFQELEESIKREERAKLEKESQPVISVNTFILPRDQWKKNLNQSVTSNFGNRSQKNMYLLNDDEEDFLNHSSLALIQNGPLPETPNPKERLTELQRRNTLCPPHLQSSYPLEIQNMTPSERKYSMVPPRRANEPVPSTSAGVGGIKRKTSEMNSSRQSPSKRRLMGVVRPSNHTMAKPTTPLAKLKTSLATRSSFRTPSSIRRLMSMHGRKSKMQ
ncbi:hypothetical protein JTE90_000743 [Oedothorax gibbosus]|uniref:Uncharacterized protein n=1 Tax=Oedothorax gibbosus TaxID=931172 RepID=A0AAV6UMU9_9ARAC|nr:hypothetical protein JTE90_000743 [Oedothorax gibbosus]